MKKLDVTRRSLARTLVGAVLVMGLLAGCSGSEEGSPQTLDMVTVNWIEGMAVSYLQAHILEDSLDMDVDVREVQGGGLAFSSVASGDRDFFNEAWLPTTHREPWEENKDDLQKLGYTFRGTTVGLAVPSYVDVDSIPDLTRYRDELDGRINGIEAGAAINGQTRRTLQRYDLDDEFSVSAASGPANWQALESAIEDKEPIVVVAWYPHWIWNDFDLKYINGAKTNHNVDIWGEPEAIFSIVEDGFVERFPKKVVCFLKEYEASDEQVFSLMTAFADRRGMSKSAAVRQWVEKHPEDVAAWMEDTRTCAASDARPEPLPDDATYSSELDS